MRLQCFKTAKLRWCCYIGQASTPAPVQNTAWRAQGKACCHWAPAICSMFFSVQQSQIINQGLHTCLQLLQQSFLFRVSPSRKKGTHLKQRVVRLKSQRHSQTLKRLLGTSRLHGGRHGSNSERSVLTSASWLSVQDPLRKNMVLSLSFTYDR